MTRPQIFAELSLEAALADARARSKLLLVDVMGAWCAPCRWMDETTWRAPEVEAWVAAKAIAVQIDSQDPSVAAFEIRSIPTLMLFRDGELLDRVTGAHDVAALLEWLARAERGEKTVREVVEVARDDIHGRRHRAEALVEHGRIDEAAAELAWIWEHALEVADTWVGVRHSYVIESIRELVSAHPSARATFAAIRDREEAKLPAADAVRDWLDLNRALGDDARTLAWLEREPRPNVDVHANLMLFELLVKHERWATLGALVADPIRALENDHERFESIAAWTAENDPPGSPIADATRAIFRAQAAVLCHALRAAGRGGDAIATETRARALDPSPAMAALLDAREPPRSIIPAL